MKIELNNEQKSMMKVLTNLIFKNEEMHNLNIKEVIDLCYSLEKREINDQQKQLFKEMLDFGINDVKDFLKSEGDFYYMNMNNKKEIEKYCNKLEITKKTCSKAHIAI